MFSKGYKNDAGYDILLDIPIVFQPFVTTVIDLGIKYTPKKGYMGFLCSRTSAASKGLIVAQCPIDTDYSGTIHAIVHNLSSKIIQYDAGEAFCQLVIVPIKYDKRIKCKIKKLGRRSTGKFGSTNK